MTFEKKVYTMEDNIKHIAFGLKDIVKELQALNMSIAQLVGCMPEKKDDGNSFPL